MATRKFQCPTCGEVIEASKEGLCCGECHLREGKVVQFIGVNEPERLAFTPMQAAFVRRLCERSLDDLDGIISRGNVTGGKGRATDKIHAVLREVASNDKLKKVLLGDGLALAGWVEVPDARN